MNQVVPVEMDIVRGVSDEELRFNIRQNLFHELREDIPQGMSGPVQIVGGGPSLNEEILDIDSDIPIIALNGSYRYLCEYGFIPEFMMVLDSNPLNEKFFGLMNASTHLLINSRVDPGVFKKLLKYKATQDPDPEPLIRQMIRIWYSAGDIEKEMFPSRKIELYEGGPTGYARDKLLFEGGSTVAISALYMAIYMGFTEFHFYGFDSCVSESGEHHAYPQHWNDGKDTQPYRCGDKWFQCEAWMVGQAADFNEALKYLVRYGMGVDCVHVHGGGLCAEVLWEFKRLRAEISKRAALPTDSMREREKYTRIWNVPEYRDHSPGESLAPHAFRKLDMKRGESICDYGCGAGDALRYFREMDLGICGIDIAPNALVKDDVPVSIGPLWGLSDHITYDYAFCCDVMEHIPPDRVDEVFRIIEMRTDKAAYFQIHCGPDSFGSVIGEALHLSVHDHRWWVDKMQEFWRHGEFEFHGKKLIAILKN